MAIKLPSLVKPKTTKPLVKAAPAKPKAPVSKPKPQAPSGPSLPKTSSSGLGLGVASLGLSSLPLVVGGLTSVANAGATVGTAAITADLAKEVMANPLALAAVAAVALLLLK